MGKVGAAYIAVTDEGVWPDQLVGVASLVASEATLHYSLERGGS